MGLLGVDTCFPLVEGVSETKLSTTYGALVATVLLFGSDGVSLAQLSGRITLISLGSCPSGEGVSDTRLSLIVRGGFLVLGRSDSAELLS